MSDEPTPARWPDEPERYAIEAYEHGSGWDDVCSFADGVAALAWARSYYAAHASHCCCVVRDSEDGRTLLSLGSPEDVEHGAWLARCPR